MREITLDQPAYPNHGMQENPMNEDDPTKALSRSLTRLTWTVSLWGVTSTIGVGMIWSDMDQSPTSVSQRPVTVPMHKDSMRLLHACRHDEDQEKLTPWQFVSWDLTAERF
jgi:hypothetical protein